MALFFIVLHEKGGSFAEIPGKQISRNLFSADNTRNFIPGTFYKIPAAVNIF